MHGGARAHNVFLTFSNSNGISRVVFVRLNKNNTQCIYMHKISFAGQLELQLYTCCKWQSRETLYGRAVPAENLHLKPRVLFLCSQRVERFNTLSTVFCRGRSFSWWSVLNTRNFELPIGISLLYQINTRVRSTQLLVGPRFRTETTAL